jgi:hypothetical protein
MSTLEQKITQINWGFLSGNLFANVDTSYSIDKQRTINKFIVLVQEKLESKYEYATITYQYQNCYGSLPKNLETTAHYNNDEPATEEDISIIDYLISDVFENSDFWCYGDDNAFFNSKEYDMTLDKIVEIATSMISSQTKKELSPDQVKTLFEDLQERAQEIHEVN